MRKSAAVFIGILFLASCGQKESATGPAPHATVQTREGVTLTGNVVASSPSEITLESDDKTRRTIAMKDVKSIDYDETTAPAAAAVPVPEPAATTAPGAPARKPAAVASRSTAPELSHERHVHPTEERITTKTYEVPAGTPVSVRVEETIDSSKAVEGQT